MQTAACVAELRAVVRGDVLQIAAKSSVGHTSARKHASMLKIHPGLWAAP